ncbi:hypothetical protein DFH09DRAFT_1196768 [Mycena vulgaris]|nr:hypothetical protein DFH09DRAFT_1196768 [Mycena vulgaris]
MDLNQTTAYGLKIPPEIWGRCWSHSPIRDLLRLVLVSRDFRDICQPLRFQHQSFAAPVATNRDSWGSSTRALRRSTLRLKKLAASDHVSSVRSWHFEGSFHYADLPDEYPGVLNNGLVEESYLEVVDTFAATLGAHRNLRSLRLVCFVIDAPFRETLALAVRLEDLYLDSCNITSRTGVQLSLRTFTLINMFSRSDQNQDHCDDPFEIVSPRPLRVLDIDESRDSLAFLAFLAHEALPFPNLVTLSVVLSDSTAKPFLTLLERCPQLTSLEIFKSRLYQPKQFLLPPTVIPHLQSFTGPRRLAAVFTLGRPVSHVALTDGLGFSPDKKSLGMDIISEVADIAHSSVAVHSLSMAAPIETALDLLAVIATRFPDLKTLDLTLNTPSPVRTYAYTTHSGEDASASGSSASAEGVVKQLSNGGLDAIGRLHPESIPDTVLPGHMYKTSGEIFPPAPGPAATITSVPESLPRLLDCICNDGISLPETLVSMRFGEPWPGILRIFGTAPSLSLAAQHSAVLAFERQHPVFRELEFVLYDTTWTRRGDVWSQKDTGTKIMSQLRRGE